MRTCELGELCGEVLELWRQAIGAQRMLRGGEVPWQEASRLRIPRGRTRDGWCIETRILLHVALQGGDSRVIYLNRIAHDHSPLRRADSPEPAGMVPPFETPGRLRRRASGLEGT